MSERRTAEPHADASQPTGPDVDRCAGDRRGRGDRRVVAGIVRWLAGHRDDPGAQQSVDPPQAGPAPEVDLPASAVQTIATGLCAPWDVAFLPDGTALVTERDTTRIMSVTPAGQVTEVQRIAQARPRGEGGLLGIAVSPNYGTDRWVYIYYTTEDDNRIARLHLGEEPQPVLTGIPGGDFHNGGRIAFGPDGMLYAATGETWETPTIAQDPDSLGGKILRVSPEGEPAPDNPTPGSPVYSLGHRNVQGLAWDRAGQLFASELGEGRCDELNLIEPGGNYGWPEVEGDGDDPRFVDPLATWCPTSTASPSGIATLGDRIYVACLRAQRLYRMGLDGRNMEALLVGDYGRLRHVAAAPDGSLWVLTSNRDKRGDPTADDDRILRLTP
jgi:glucose/arabinose dehydrogenase